MNCFVKNLPQEMIPKELDIEFSKFGDIKSIRISTKFAQKNGGENGQLLWLPYPPVSNRFGFVCFQSPEYADKAVDAGITNGIAIIKY
jgi:RNA recognition motif-containing protein